MLYIFNRTDFEVIIDLFHCCGETSVSHCSIDKNSKSYSYGLGMTCVLTQPYDYPVLPSSPLGVALLLPKLH